MLNYYILGDSSTMDSLTASIPPFLSVEFLGSSTDPGAAYSQILARKPDVVFIDEDLINISEEVLSLLGKASMLVFTSGSRQTEPKMRFYNPVDYTSSNSGNVSRAEPAGEQKQKEGRRRAHRDNSEGVKDYILVRTKSQSTGAKITVVIKFADIIYIESSRNYVEIHTEGNTHVTAHIPLKAMDSKLPAQFVRVNKSYLVNLNKITSIEGGDHIVLNNDLKNTMTIGRAYKPRFMKWKKQYGSKLLEKSKAVVLGVLPYVVFGLTDWCEFNLYDCPII